jgi:hypothetical protein
MEANNLGTNKSWMHLSTVKRNSEPMGNSLLVKMHAIFSPNSNQTLFEG